MLYVTSDLHGYGLEKFQNLLKVADFSKNDCCFILGDVIDRGYEAIKMLRWIFQQPNIKMILGNHEEMLLSCEFLFNDGFSFSKMSEKERKVYNHWTSNGGETTLDELSKLNHKTVKHMLDMLKEVPLIETVSIDGKKFILTHSGLGNFDNSKEINTYTAKELLWNRPNLSDAYYRDAITIFGHTPTCYIDEQSAGKAIFTDTWIDIDAGVSCGFPPMMLRLNDMREFYIDD